MLLLSSLIASFGQITLLPYKGGNFSGYYTREINKCPTQNPAFYGKNAASDGQSFSEYNECIPYSYMSSLNADGYAVKEFNSCMVIQPMYISSFNYNDGSANHYIENCPLSSPPYQSSNTGEDGSMYSQSSNCYLMPYFSSSLGDGYGETNKSECPSIMPEYLSSFDYNDGFAIAEQANCIPLMPPYLALNTSKDGEALGEIISCVNTTYLASVSAGDGYSKTNISECPVIMAMYLATSNYNDGFGANQFYSGLPGCPIPSKPYKGSGYSSFAKELCVKEAFVASESGYDGHISTTINECPSFMSLYLSSSSYEDGVSSDDIFQCSNLFPPYLSLNVGKDGAASNDIFQCSVIIYNSSLLGDGSNFISIAECPSIMPLYLSSLSYRDGDDNDIMEGCQDLLPPYLSLNVGKDGAAFNDNNACVSIPFYSSIIGDGSSYININQCPAKMNNYISSTSYSDGFALGVTASGCLAILPPYLGLLESNDGEDFGEYISCIRISYYSSSLGDGHSKNIISECPSIMPNFLASYNYNDGFGNDNIGECPLILPPYLAATTGSDGESFSEILSCVFKPYYSSATSDGATNLSYNSCPTTMPNFLASFNYKDGFSISEKVNCPAILPPYLAATEGSDGEAFNLFNQCATIYLSSSLKDGGAFTQINTCPILPMYYASTNYKDGFSISDIPGCLPILPPYLASASGSDGHAFNVVINCYKYPYYSSSSSDGHTSTILNICPILPMYYASTNYRDGAAFNNIVKCAANFPPYLANTNGSDGEGMGDKYSCLKIPYFSSITGDGFTANNFNECPTKMIMYASSSSFSDGYGSKQFFSGLPGCPIPNTPYRGSGYYSLSKGLCSNNAFSASALGYDGSVFSNIQECPIILPQYITSSQYRDGFSADILNGCPTIIPPYLAATIGSDGEAYGSIISCSKITYNASASGSDGSYYINIAQCPLVPIYQSSSSYRDGFSYSTKDGCPLIIPPYLAATTGTDGHSSNITNYCNSISYIASIIGDGATFINIIECPSIMPIYLASALYKDGFSSSLKNGCPTIIPPYLAATSGSDGHSLGIINLCPSISYIASIIGDGVYMKDFSQCPFMPIYQSSFFYNDGFSTSIKNGCPTILPPYLASTTGKDGEAFAEISSCIIETSMGSNSGSDGFAEIFGNCFKNEAPLPVELLNFNVRLNKIKKIADILWTTVTEINSDYFTIEKTKNGLEYYFVNNVKAAGNSNYKIDYKTIDQEIWNGFSYYRLTQTDFDGKKYYSELREIYYNEDSRNMEVFPNPSNGKDLFLKYSGFEDSKINITIYDVLGRNIFNEILYINKSNSTNHKIHALQLADGAYNIVIKDNNEKIILNKKLLILKN